ncbi:MAG: hypothetical protein ACLPHI_01875 [Terriglobales bacterium]|jgi:hypothetical protein
MPSVAPAARGAFLAEAVSGLQRLQRFQREMARVSRQDENYARKNVALQATIEELRKTISDNLQRVRNQPLE